MIDVTIENFEHEVIATSQIFDHAARLKSFEILSRVWPKS